MGTRVHGAATPKILDCLSMLCFGFCVLVHLGATYHLIIVTGIRFNDVSVVGAIRGIGETILEAIVDGPDFELESLI